MPKSNKFSLCDPDSIQIRCGTQNRYFGPPAFPDSVLFQNTIPNPPTFDYPLPRSSLSARRHRNIRTSQDTSAKSPQCSICVSQLPRSVQIPITVPGSAQIQSHRPESVIPGTPILRIGTFEISFPGSPHSESLSPRAAHRARTGVETISSCVD